MDKHTHRWTDIHCQTDRMKWTERCAEEYVKRERQRALHCRKQTNRLAYRQAGRQIDVGLIAVH